MSSTIEKALEKALEHGGSETQAPPPTLDTAPAFSGASIERAMAGSVDAWVQGGDGEEWNRAGEQISDDIGVLDSSSAAITASMPAPPLQTPTSSREVRIDLARLQDLGMITPLAERSQIAEEFRMIKRPLIKNAFGEGAAPVDKGNLIMVTSAFPSEGKTFTAVNLAISMAMEFDKTVLLVDADVARPSVGSLLGIEGGPGLVDYLAGDHYDLADLFVKTDIPRLTLLPSGRRHVHSTELLASDNMRAVAEEMSRRYADRIVIFDSPPLLATSEATVLASLMGQIVVVVEAGKTTHEALKEAMSHLDENKAIGMVLNKSRQSFGSEYYGAYGSYYGGRNS